MLVHYGRSATEAEDVVSTIKAKGGQAHAVTADLATSSGAFQLSTEVRSIVGSRLDVLVLNAGISKAARIADYTPEDFDNLVATNVRGPFFLVQQLLPLLGGVEHYCHIVCRGAHNRRKPGIGESVDSRLRFNQRSD